MIKPILGGTYVYNGELDIYGSQLWTIVEMNNLVCKLYCQAEDKYCTNYDLNFFKDDEWEYLKEDLFDQIYKRLI